GSGGELLLATSRPVRGTRQACRFHVPAPLSGQKLRHEIVAIRAHDLSCNSKVMTMTDRDRDLISKAPAVTLGFWIIKILATTLGETGGDTVSMTLSLGYLVGTAIFFSVL